MRRQTRHFVGCSATLALTLGGCAVGPKYHAPRIATPAALTVIAPLSSVTVHGAQSAVDPAQWWRSLQDPELDSLVTRAVETNPDIEIALTRLQQARTEEAGLIGSALPEVSADAAAGNGTGSDLTRAGAEPALRAGDNKGSLPQIKQVAGFSADWGIDLFGYYRRAIETGHYDVQAAAWARNAVLVSVISDVAHNYVDMRGLQMRRAILKQSIDTAQQSRDLTRTRFNLGITNELDLQLAERQLATLQAELPPLLGDIQIKQNAIAALLNQYPEALSAELNAPGALPALPEHIAAGLPLDLLQRRPDVRRAERRLAAANARVGVATANLFPRVALTGALGTQSGSIGAGGSHIWSFGPSVYWPLLDFGSLDAQVRIADLRTHEQLVAYKKAIVGAVQDADSAIADFSAQQQRLSSLAMAMQAAQRAVDLAQQRYDRGLTDFLNVIDAERQQYSLADQYTKSEQAAADAFIYLYKALGGGWEQYQGLPSIKRPQPAVLAEFRSLLTRDQAATP